MSSTTGPNSTSGEDSKKDTKIGAGGAVKIDLSNIKIYADDFTEEMRKKAIEVTHNAFHMNNQSDGNNKKVFSTIASRIRDHFQKHFSTSGGTTSVDQGSSNDGNDSSMDGGWSCVIGKSFGSCITHQ